MPIVPDRSAGVVRSGIRAIMDLAWEVGDEVLRLEVGQPDAAPPDHVLEAMQQAIARKETGYTPNAGIPELRRACARKLGEVNRIDCPPEQVVVVAGSMQGLLSAVLGLGEPGDEMLVPDPGWPNYAMAGRLAGLRCVPYPLLAGNGFRPDFSRIEPLVTERTRLVVTNSPSNPLGVVLTEEETRGWIELSERHDLWLISDECYDELVFEGVATSPASLSEAGERVVTVHSFSKTYAMTGLRVGYVSGPLPVIETMTKMQEALVACVNGPAQRGAVAALEGPQDYVTTMRDRYRQRRDRAVEVATEVGLPRLVPQGAFYLWLPLDPRTVGDTMELCRRLVTDHGVAVAPGETFGANGAGALRVSLAAPVADIEEGLRRLAGAIAG